jgi:apolipoprotein N-acyltransferase
MPSWRTQSWDVLALISGLALPLAFSPFGITPIAVLALAVLFAGWRSVSAQRALWRGWLFGLGMFGVGVSWVHESFQFSHVSAAMAIALTTLLVLILAMFPALLGYLSARLFRGSEAVRLTLVLPGGWVLSEWIRGWFVTGFTWLQLGYSQIDSPLGSIAPLFGVYGVSWLTALISGGFALAVSRGSRHVISYVLIATLLLGLGLVLSQQRWTQEAGDDTVSVALVQGNVPQALKWDPEQRQRTLERYLRLTRRHWNADLVVWPESALPGFFHDFAPALASLTREAIAHNTQILLGINTLDPRAQRYFNSIVAIGNYTGLYHKRHLVPFTEYLPLDRLLRPLVEAFELPVSSFTPGPPAQGPIDMGEYKVGTSVCYEVAFGEEIIEPLPEATLLVNVSNDAWFGHSIGPHQHLEIARMRALETGRYLLRATNTGISAIIGPDGRIRARAPQFATEVLTGEIIPLTGATPYVRMGNAPVLVGLMLSLGLAGFLTSGAGRRKQRRHAPRPSESSDVGAL